MNGLEKSDSAVVAVKPANKAAPIVAVATVGGAKGRDQGEHRTTTHAPDPEPGKRVPGVGRCTQGRQGKNASPLARQTL